MSHNNFFGVMPVLMLVIGLAAPRPAAAQQPGVATSLALFPTGSSNAFVECIADYRAGVRGDVQAQWVSRATRIFVADVKSIDDSSGPRRIRFDVLEGFKGAPKGESEIAIDLEVHNFPFQVGQRVLVYGFPAEMGPRGSQLRPDVLSTSCSPTRVITLDDPELAPLRRLAAK